MYIHVTLSEFRRCKGGMRARVDIETEHGQDLSSPSPRFKMPFHYAHDVDPFRAPESVTRYLGRMFDGVKLDEVDEREPGYIRQTYTGQVNARIAAAGCIDEGVTA